MSSTITIHIKQGQNKWDVTVDPSATITALKDEISKVSSIPSENQRLIYSGKILKDDQTVESYNILDDHSIHLVKSGGHQRSNPDSINANTTTTNDQSTSQDNVPTNITSGQTSGFNPLADMTGARYAGYLNMPSSDMFGPDGGMNDSGPSQDDMFRMMENPIFQSQMNEMLSNPQMVDFLIQSNPQLQALGPQARQMLQSPMFRQMLTNPEMMRQSMQFARQMGLDPSTGTAGGAGAAGLGGIGGADAFPAPGGDDDSSTTNTTTTTENANSNTNNTGPDTSVNPFAALLNPAMNPFANLGNANTNMSGTDPAATGAENNAANPTGMPNFASFLQSAMAQPPAYNSAAAAPPQDTRPPEERYETQLRQLNDMGFFDFDRNVAALRRSGGSVQGAVDALLNNYV